MASIREAFATGQRRLHVRHAGALAAVALGSALVVGVPLYLLAFGMLEQALGDRLEGIAELAAVSLDGKTVEGGGARRLLALIREEADLDGICLFGRAGEPPSLSVPDPRVCEMEAGDAALLAGLSKQDSAHTGVRRAPDGTPYLFAFAPLKRPLGRASSVAVRASDPYLARLDSLRVSFAAAGATIMLLVGLLGAWSARRLVRPVERLVAATGRLGEGGELEPLERASTVELAALQDAFSRMAVLIRARETSLRALAGAVAHEVRNPAHALRLHLGLLRRELSHEARPNRIRIETLQGLLDELDATVDAFLLFAQGRAVRRQTINLRVMLERAASEATVEASDAEVCVDPILLSRAVANLVRNAKQAGSARTTVRASCTDALVIEVEDSGPGFSEPLLSTAFEPFVAGRPDGTGLGLAIVSAVARAHGGTARIARSGAGCTIVELRLPLA